MLGRNTEPYHQSTPEIKYRKDASCFHAQLLLPLPVRSRFGSATQMPLCCRLIGDLSSITSKRLSIRLTRSPAFGPASRAETAPSGFGNGVARDANICT